MQKSRVLPIKVGDPSAPTQCGVKRKGKRVFVGPPGGQGAWLDFNSSHTAREAVARLNAHLTKGWEGTLEDLVDQVISECDRGRAALDEWRKAKRRVDLCEIALKRARKAERILLDKLTDLDGAVPR